MAFAIIRDGAPEEIFQGQPFTTTQFLVTTDEEAAWSFSPIGTIIDHPLSHADIALAHYGVDDRVRFCIHAFDLPVPPAGKRLETYGLTIVSGVVVAAGVFSDPEVPAEVSRLQAKQALRQAGKLADVETAIAAASDEVKIYWSDASSFHRDHPTLATMTATLAMSSAEVDDLFRAAAAIT